MTAPKWLEKFAYTVAHFALFVMCIAFLILVLGVMAEVGIWLFTT